MVLCIAGIPLILFWFKSIIPTHEEHRNSVLRSYKSLKYEGVVINKFRDLDEHNFRKVIIKENNTSRTVLFNNQTSNIYDYIEIGDSIIKEESSFQIQVFRNGQDTVLVMRYDDAQN